MGFKLPYYCYCCVWSIIGVWHHVSVWFVSWLGTSCSQSMSSCLKALRFMKLGGIKRWLRIHCERSLHIIGWYSQVPLVVHSKIVDRKWPHDQSHPHNFGQPFQLYCCRQNPGFKWLIIFSNRHWACSNKALTLHDDPSSPHVWLDVSQLSMLRPVDSDVNDLSCLC